MIIDQFEATLLFQAALDGDSDRLNEAFKRLTAEEIAHVVEAARLISSDGGLELGKRLAERAREAGV